MKLFTLHDSITQGGKNYPQIQDHKGGVWKLNAPHSIYNLTYYKLPDDDFIDFGVLLLAKKCILTDNLSISGPSSGLLISHKANDVFTNSNLGSYRIFPAIIKVNDQEIDYYWFHIITNCNDYIIYEKSEFQEVFIGNGSKHGDILHFNCMNEIKQYNTLIDKQCDESNSPLRKVSYNKLTINKEFITNHDIFRIEHAGRNTNFIITEYFKQKIIDNNLTGFEFVESQDIFTE